MALNGSMVTLVYLELLEAERYSRPPTSASRCMTGGVLPERLEIGTTGEVSAAHSLLSRGRWTT